MVAAGRPLRRGLSASKAIRMPQEHPDETPLKEAQAGGDRERQWAMPAESLYMVVLAAAVEVPDLWLGTAAQAAALV